MSNSDYLIWLEVDLRQTEELLKTKYETIDAYFSYDKDNALYNPQPFKLNIRIKKQWYGVLGDSISNCIEKLEQQLEKEEQLKWKQSAK